MTPEELEESNRSKYGDKSADLIAHNYSVAERDGDLWCLMNARRYIGRYLKEGSSKVNNTTDLMKALDYVERAFEKSMAPERVNENYGNVYPANRVLEQNININIEAYLQQRNPNFLLNVKLMIMELQSRHTEKEDETEIIE